MDRTVSRHAVVTGTQRRRYEYRTRHRDPIDATMAAIERAILDAGGRNMAVQWEGANVIMVTARTPTGGITGGRAAIAEFDNTAIALMHAGAICVRALIEDTA